MKISQDPRWPNAHKRLRTLYEERVPKGMSQAEFGATYGLGSQGIVWQYLNGYTPLNIEAAAKFAKGLRCTISDISPEMASALQRDILPVLGPKALRAALARVSVVTLLVVPPMLQQDAEAAIYHNTQHQPLSFAKYMNIIHIGRKVLRWLNLAATLQRLTARLSPV